MPGKLKRRGGARTLLAPVTFVAAALLLGVLVAGAQGAAVTSAAFSGGAGTVTVGSTLYAKQDAALTLTVMTDADTRCVEISGASGTTSPAQGSTGDSSVGAITRSLKSAGPAL